MPMAMEAPRPRLTLAAIVVAVTAALLVLAHGVVGAVTPPPRAPAPAALATVRPWVARLQALHDLSSTTTTTAASLDATTSLATGAGGEQQQGDGGFAECWGAVVGLSACSSEILLFLVNGESYIGPECCAAVRGATRYCWPAVLASVGLSAEEADVLRGFCDGEEAAAEHQLGGAPPPVAGPGRGARRL